MCGKEFLAEWGHQIYCGSRKEKIGCSYKARVDKHRKFRAKHKGYTLKYNNKARKTLRKLILIRDKNKCNICGMKSLVEGFFDIDHKNGICVDDRIENLWVLCPSCHRLKTIKNNENKRRIKVVPSE